MKKTLTPLPRSGGRSRTGRWFHQALVTAVTMSAAISTQAAIPIVLGNNPTIDFSTTPAPTEWATYDITVGAAGTYTTPAALDAGAQTIDAAVVTTAVGVTAANGTARLARHNTAGGYLVTQPTGVPMAVLMARLQNNTAGDLNVLNITYNYTIPVAPVTDECPGQRVFWSLTGAPNSWTLIPSLSGVTTAGLITASVGVGSWTSGSILYVLWLDDNNLTGADGAFTIDNVVFNSQVLGPINITSNPTNFTTAERGAAAFTVVASGSPQDFHWRSNGVPIAGANTATYSIPSAPFSANGSVFSCVVSNSLGAQTSAGATLTVTADTTPPTGVSASASTNGTVVTIVFTEPMNPIFNELGNFRFYLTGTDPIATEFFPDFATIVGNTATLTFNISPFTDGVNYSIELRDLFDTAATPNLIAPYPTVLPIRRDLLLIELTGPNSVWRFAPDTETNLFDTGWETIGYTETGWLSGESGIGRDASANVPPLVTGNLANTPPYPIADSRAVFFRRNFYLPASTVGATLRFRHSFEDGAVIYVNGVEARRVNAPAGPLSVTSRAPAGAAEPVVPSGELSLTTSNLVAGDNLIAVVVLQNGATSSDMEMAMELVATIGTFAAGPPSIVTQPANQTVVEGGNANFSVVADGALPLHYQWSRNGTPIANATNATLSLTGVLPSQAGNYRVTVTNNLGSSNSAIAILTVNADLINPVFVSATGPTNMNIVVVTFYDQGGFNLADLQNPAKYSIGLTAGGGALAISSAVAAAAGTNMVVTLTTATPRLANQNYTVATTLTDRSVALHPMTPASRSVVATVIIFGFNKVWRFDETGNNLGSLWSGVGYNDSAWPSGAGFLAFENSLAPLTLFTNLAGGTGTNTSLNLTNQTLAGISGTNITFYFRTTVASLPFNPSTPGNSIQAVSYFDDGGVIYVNGAEALRFNLTNSPVALNYTNLATAGSTEGAGGLITSNLTGFVQGNNIIAAEVHQNAINSSDVAWGMQLEATVTTFGSGCPQPHISQNAGTGQVTITWTGSATLEEATVLANPSANTVWVLSPRVNGVAFTPSGTTKYYRLRCP